jgi:4'-phosphopantetheinyl transferase
MSQGSIIVAYSALHELPPAASDSLSRAEVERAEAFKSPQRRQEYLCARALLRSTLERCTGDPASSHELTVTEKGKPVCVDGPAVSIAHSGKLVVCAATDLGDIGIDIEAPGRRRNVKEIASNYFAEDEAAWLATQPEDRFYMLWVLKEAWLKATGVGIAGGLSALHCIVTPPGITAHVASGSLAALSLYAVEDALVSLATTTAAHRDVIIARWDPLSSRFDENHEFRLVAATSQQV